MGDGQNPRAGGRGGRSARAGRILLRRGVGQLVLAEEPVFLLGEGVLADLAFLGLDPGFRERDLLLRLLREPDLLIRSGDVAARLVALDASVRLLPVRCLCACAARRYEQRRA